MTRRLLDATDDQVGAALGSLDLRWPSAPPDLDTRVTAGIREASRRPRPPRPAMPHRRKVILLIAAALLMVAAAATAAKLVIDLGAITIERLPSEGPLPTVATIPDLGEPVTLEEAEAITGTEPALPSALGTPDRVWVDRPEDLPDGAKDVRIVMAWLADEDLPAIPGSPYGAVLIRWDANVDFGTKLVGDTFRTTRVPGWPRAYWVTGEHELVLYGEEGPTRILVRGHVLLWGDGRTTFRLETSLPRPDAVEIASSSPAWPALAGGGGCHEQSEGTGSDVVISDACFQPSLLHAEVDATVRFLNKDDFAHNVYGSGWAIGELEGGGGSGTVSFGDEGLYPFQCSLHPGMTGAVIVGDGEGPGNGSTIAVGLGEPAPPPDTSTARVGSVTDEDTGWLGAGIVGLFMGVAVGIAVMTLTSMTTRRRERLVSSPA